MKVQQLSGRDSVQTFGTTIPAEQFETAVDGRLTEYARDAKIDGFRKGKVPMAIIRRRYGDEVEAAIASDFLQSAIEHAVDERKLVPLDVLPERLPKRAPGEPLDLRFTVHGVAKFEVGPFDRLEIEVPVADVTDADVDAELKEFTYMLGSAEVAPADFSARPQDTVVVELFDRSDVANPKRINATGYATPRSFQETWGKEADIEGIRTGENRTLRVSPPAGNCYDKPFTLGIVVQAIHKREPAELPDLMKRLNAETEDDLRSNVRSMLVQATASATERLKAVRLVGELVRANQLKLPGPYVEKVASAYDAGQSGPLVPSERQMGSEGLARMSITAELLLSKIADDKNIQVTRDEIVRFVVQSVDSNHKDAELTIKKHLADADVVRTVALRIRREKALGLAMEEARLTEKRVPNDMIRRMMSTIPPITLEARMRTPAGGAATAVAGGAQ